jgi:CRP-like cAMP-binding protein
VAGGQTVNRLEFLRHHWMMKGLSPEEVESIDRLIQVKEFRPGAKIFQKQSSRRDLFLILEGEATLHNEERREESGIERLRSGDVLGELGFLTGHPAPYSAQASTKMLVLQLPFEAFKAMLLPEQRNVLNVMSRCAQLMLQRLEQWKNREEAALYVKNQQLVKKKSFWLFSILGLILAFFEPYKAFGSLPAFTITLLQVFLPVLFIHFYLKEPLRNWGWNLHFIGRSLLQAVICIALFGGVVQLISQVTDLPALSFFSPSMWRNMTFPISSVFGYLLFVMVQEWLRRGIVALSLQRGLENGRGWWAALLSALLFLGFAPIDFPFFAIGLFIKDFVLAKLFLRAPHLLGVIIIHFALGIFFAYLGWYTL